MATEKQIQANKLNALKSTGPKTPEGKAKSSLNRLSHGFASNARLMPGEDPEEFKSLILDLVNEFQPATASEQILVEDMATNRWLSLRAFRLQGEAFRDLRVVPGTFALPNDLGLLIRYQTSFQRAFHKAHDELVKTRKERLNSDFGFESQNFGEQLSARRQPLDPTPDSPTAAPPSPPKEPEKSTVISISKNFSPEEFGLPANLAEIDPELFAQMLELHRKVS
jgi:hypothetical protein